MLQTPLFHVKQIAPGAFGQCNSWALSGKKKKKIPSLSLEVVIGWRILGYPTGCITILPVFYLTWFHFKGKIIYTLFFNKHIYTISTRSIIRVLGFLMPRTQSPMWISTIYTHELGKSYFLKVSRVLTLQVTSRRR